uniref:Aspartate/glutamate/uridylate kinase domain-containing protein n=1 Tax=Corethron hystrix TaxID=216773 RepID=A0A7S1BK16_9STRA|mmetsp:Transcript_31524/g.72202  ORF Transcript_31524/g.72202 Transcript_31524/m.72202 type:complete len:383 (+) Transcript_31524:3-1151(+)
MVFHIPGELFEWEGFKNLIDDIALTWLLGIKLVLVVGCRSLVDRQLQSMNIETKRHNGRRVTDRDTLDVVKTQAGYARFEIERLLGRALNHGGNRNDKSQKANVVSGNFYTSQPLGVLNGVDFEFSGKIRRIDIDKVHQAHKNSDVVVMTNLGVSPSGELFNMYSECIAAKVAGELQASKVFYLTTKKDVVFKDSINRVVHSLQASEAKDMLLCNNVSLSKQKVIIENESENLPIENEVLEKIGWSVLALENGVKRAHIVCPEDGSILEEIYTVNGSGLLISKDLYEGVRQATSNDTLKIYGLIQPLVDAGVLAKRTKRMIEDDINSYYVLTRDSHIVACGQLHFLGNRNAEICFIASSENSICRDKDVMLGKTGWVVAEKK